MAQRHLKQTVIQPPSSEELLALAATRVELPAAPFLLDYQDDVDTLYISLKQNAHPTHSEAQLDDSVIFNYENERTQSVVLHRYTAFSRSDRGGKTFLERLA